MCSRPKKSETRLQPALRKRPYLTLYFASIHRGALSLSYVWFYTKCQKNSRTSWQNKRRDLDLNVSVWNDIFLYILWPGLWTSISWATYYFISLFGWDMHMVEIKAEIKGEGKLSFNEWMKASELTHVKYPQSLQDFPLGIIVQCSVARFARSQSSVKQSVGTTGSVTALTPGIIHD